MKKKHLFIIPMLALDFGSSAIAQDVHPALKKTASKINTSGEYVSMTKLDGDIAAITQYIDLILKTAKKNDKQVPSFLSAVEILNILGLDSIKSVGSSAKELDNAWINHSYLENGGSNKGIFSIFGKTNQELVAPTICPAGTDLAVQMQLDLRELAPMLMQLAKITGEDKIIADMEKMIPELGMTPTQLLAKLDVTVSIAIDVNTKEADQTNKVALITGSNAIIRIDGLNWLWNKLGDQIIAQSKIPMDKLEKNGVVTYSVPAEMRKEMMGYSPQLIIDNANGYIWISSKPEFYAACVAGENTLAGSAEFKAAMEHLPTKGNSMMYLSKAMLKTAKSQYEIAAISGVFGKDFEEGKEIIDRLMEDIMESDKGWAMVLNKDNDGILIASRGPLGTHHSTYLTPLALMGANFMTFSRSEEPYVEETLPAPKLRKTEEKNN